jgi:radical SAM protein (TIGR01212 family)
MRGKWQTSEFIPYLQAYTNTHTSPANLEKILDQVSKFDGAVMIDLATRADCLENEKIDTLRHFSEKIPLTVELGLQTSNDETAKKINRCHSYEVFKDAFYRLRDLAPKVKIGIHIINGLPGETSEDMQNTATCVRDLHPDIVKIHLLHVLSGTPLAHLYESGKYVPLEKDEYVNIVCNQLEIMPPDVVIERVTGDGLADSLLAPLWSKKKVAVINDIDKELVKRNTYQGVFYK